MKIKKYQYSGIKFDYYSGRSTLDIAFDYSVCPQTIGIILKKSGIELRTKGFGKGNNKGTKRIAWIYHSLWFDYNRRSKQKNMDFTLTKSEFETLIISNCYYCNQEPSKRNLRNYKNVLVNGIDRKDNLKGYTLDNCVPCCSNCNTIKMCLSEDQFIEKIKQIIKIYEFRNRKL